MPHFNRSFMMAPLKIRPNSLFWNVSTSGRAADDGVIALGGDSIDLAKAVALPTSHGGRLADYNVKTGGSAGIGKVSPRLPSRLRQEPVQKLSAPADEPARRQQDCCR